MHRYSPLSDEALREALEIAGHPDAAAERLTRLPLRHFEVWAAVAARRRLPYVVREALVEVATLAPLCSWEGRRWTDAGFPLRWARMVLSVPWLTPNRLGRLVPALEQVLHTHEMAPALVTHYLATHRNATVGVVVQFLEQFWGRSGPAEDQALEVLRLLPHPWPTVAGVCDWMQRTYGRLVWPVQPWDTGDGVLDGIDETSGRVLVGILPTWASTLPAAVATARDVAGNPDPRLLATNLTHPAGQQEWQQALELASATETSSAQLRLLPLDHLPVWQRVAQRGDLDTALRRSLYMQAMQGPRVVPGLAGHTTRERATEWAGVILAASCLTGHRLAKLGERAAVHGADPAVVLPVLAGNPRVSAEALTVTVAGYRHLGWSAGDRSPVDVAVEALTTLPGPGPWPHLGPVLRELRTVRKPLPDWHLDLVDVRCGGKKLDRLKLDPGHLKQLLRMLPTWDGNLAAAVAASR